MPPASAGIPILVMNLKVGEKVICHFVNQLSTESAGIHWHGLELDNDSDGTPVSQDAVLPGQSYTYQFDTFRPGIFWFHPHMLPGNTLFGGMYGVIIIPNNIEASLKGTILPDDANTHTLAMSDIDFDASGVVGKQFGMPAMTKKLNELVELCHLRQHRRSGRRHGRLQCRHHTRHHRPGKRTKTRRRCTYADVRGPFREASQAAALEREHLPAFQAQAPKQRRQQTLSHRRSGWPSGQRDT